MVTCYHQECLHPWRIQFACLQPARLEVTNTNERMAEVCWPKLAIIHSHHLTTNMRAACATNIKQTMASGR